MAKIVVKREARSMGLNGGVIPKSRMGKLIERCVKKSIADPSRHHQVIMELKQEVM